MTDTRRSYHQELDLVRDEIVRMASSVCVNGGGYPECCFFDSEELYG